MINTFGAETIFRDFRWSIGSVLLGTQGLSSLGHKECPASNTRNVLLGTQGRFCVEHKECPAWNTGNDDTMTRSYDGMRTRSYDGIMMLEKFYSAASGIRSIKFLQPS